VDRLQIQEANLFNPRAAYDGARNMFRTRPLNLPNSSGIVGLKFVGVAARVISCDDQFRVYMDPDPNEAMRRGAPGIRVKIVLVAQIDPR